MSFLGSWYQDANKAVNTAVGDVGKVASRGYSDANQWVNDALKGVVELSPSIEGVKTFFGGGGGGGGKKKPAAPAQASSTTDTVPQPANTPTDDALTMGIGMFFQNYLAPLMAKQNAANAQLTNQWGAAMNQALQNPMPAGVKQTLQAQLPQDMFLQNLANQSGYQQAAGYIPFQQMIQGLGAETSASQASQEAYTHAVTEALLNQGAPQAVVNAVAPYLAGGASGLAGQLLQGSLASITPVPGATTNAAGTTGATAGQVTTPAAAQSQTQTAATAIQQAVQSGSMPTAAALTVLQNMGYTMVQAQQILGIGVAGATAGTAASQTAGSPTLPTGAS